MYRKPRVLAKEVKTALTSNQIAVVIGARGTEKSVCADELAAEWEAVGIKVLRIDASKARFPEDLNAPLAEALNCEPNSLTVEHLEEDEVVRVIVDRCDFLFDQPWVAAWQEQWRSALTAQASQGRLAAVLFGRPLFRQIAGGDASPLMNAGRVLTVRPLTRADIEARFELDPQSAEAIRKKTGGHPTLTSLFVEAIDGRLENLRGAVRAFVERERSYVVQLVQDQSLGGRAILGELLRDRSPVHVSALIGRHFEAAHADGLEAVEDLCGCGLVERSGSGDCAVAADLLRNVDGLREIATAPEMSVPTYDAMVMDACWRCLFLSENQLRRMIAERLGAVDAAWWVLHVPPEVRAAAEGRKKGEIVIATMEEDQSHPLMYLTVSELFQLVFANWKRVFGAAFSPLSQRTVEKTSQQFETIRNRLAHSRPVSEDQLREFEMLSRRLGLS